MKGLELSEQYYRTYGEPMLKEKFPELFPKIAVGLMGSGSEVLGYDDETSQDHDFSPGFCVILPGEEVVSRREAFLLERAYSQLPKSFEGFTRQKLSPVGGNRLGVIRFSDFLRQRTGSPTGELDVYDWLTLPEQNLLEITAGKIFSDPSGFVSEIREDLKTLPEAIRLKKLAGNLLYAAQTGVYNYERCLEHKESGAAQLSLFDFAKSAMQCCFVLSERYMPYYKWRFRAFRELPAFGHHAEKMEYLISSPNEAGDVEKKREMITGILEDILTAAGFEKGTDPGKAAYELNDKISDGELRNLNILAAAGE